MNRILFYTNLDSRGELSDYTIYFLQSIKHLYGRIVFISNKSISNENIQKIDNICNTIIILENIAFCFEIWKTVLMNEGWDNLSQYDNITLMSDSFFGPFFNPENIYIQMETSKLDFWGFIPSKRKKVTSSTHCFSQQDISNYFLFFKRNIVSSKVFQMFWADLKCQSNERRKSIFYEKKLISILIKDGHKYGVLCDSNGINTNSFNKLLPLSHYSIVKDHIPFITINSLIEFSYPKYLINLIREKTDYPINLIDNYITDTYIPNISLQICDKIVSATLDQKQKDNNLSIAIHLHVYYMDILEAYLQSFEKTDVNFDLYITTDSTEKKDKILIYFKSKKFQYQLKHIFVFENRGRDVLPWLNISDTLNKYNIVGHFHTKKTTSQEEWVGISWLENIFELLLTPLKKIINEFNANPKLGIVIPEIPIARQIYPHLQDRDNHKYFSKSLNKIWKQLNIEKNIDFKHLQTFIFPYGSMFFYRPIALKSLFQFCFTSNDFPSEPITSDLTLAHCIERLPVYIAWGNNYDYRIMAYSPPKTNSFDNQERLSRLFFEFQNKITYRVGHFILIVPKIIKRLINLR